MSIDPNPFINILSRCSNKSFYPSFNPKIYSLSVTTSVSGVYSVVSIYGLNFFPPSNGSTYVNFGSFTNLPITFYNSFNISFVVPLNAGAGNYNVVVVNLYNGNFSTAVDNSYPSIPNFSNQVIYTIT